MAFQIPYSCVLPTNRNCAPHEIIAHCMTHLRVKRALHVVAQVFAHMRAAAASDAAWRAQRDHLLRAHDRMLRRRPSRPRLRGLPGEARGTCSFKKSLKGTGIQLLPSRDPEGPRGTSAPGGPLT